MNNSLFSRNIIIHSEIKRTAQSLKNNAIPLILLKGAALIEMYEGYSASRAMDDIDILTAPKNFKEAKGILKNLGYSEVNSDPFSFHNKSNGITIDICAGLWYLNSKENLRLITNSLENELIEPGSNCYRPPLEDIYIHIISHAVIHHLEITASSRNDISLIENSSLYSVDKDEVIRKAGIYSLTTALDLFKNRNPKGIRGIVLKKLFNSSLPAGGHISRFLFLPFSKKISYILKSLFPDSDFIKYRYSLSNSIEVIAYRLLRPFLIFANLLKFSFSFLLTLGLRNKY